MIALLTLSRKLHKARPKLPLPLQILNPLLTHHSNPSPPVLVPHCLHYLTAAFHRTVTEPRPISTHIRRVIDFEECINQSHKNDQLVVDRLVQIIQDIEDLGSENEGVAFLDDSGVKPSKDFIFSAIWALRDEWKLALLVFKWGLKCGCCVEKTWHLMVWLLGNHQKFSTAWSLICDLYRAQMDTQKATLILIDRYAAANCADKAIETFQIMEKFRLSPDQTIFFTFLNILCEHGNIEEAEEFMFLNKKLFPLETAGFNIILNGWCNIAIDVYEAKRVWREMSKCCILPNEPSYIHMISCFSRVGNLFDSLRLYDEMKKRGWIPGAEVFSSLIYVLTSENCLNEALKTLDKMKETGLKPDTSTYNSMIYPLCKAFKMEEAKTILALMMEDNVHPNIDTYHALLTGGNREGTLEVLSHMKGAGIGPSQESFDIIFHKFFKSEQPEDAVKMWAEMEKYQVEPLSAHYNTMVKGLVRCGLLVEARKFYEEMNSKGIIADPKLKRIMKEPVEKNDHQIGEKEASNVRYSRKGKQFGNLKRSELRNEKRLKKSGKKCKTRFEGSDRG